LAITKQRSAGITEEREFEIAKHRSLRDQQMLAQRRSSDDGGDGSETEPFHEDQQMRAQGPFKPSEMIMSDSSEEGRDSASETEWTQGLVPAQGPVQRKHFYRMVKNLEHCLVLSYDAIFGSREISESGYILRGFYDDDVAVNIMCHKRYGNVSNTEHVLKGVIIINYINDFSVVNLRVSSFAELSECVDFVRSLDIHRNIFIGYSVSNPDINTPPPSGVYIENLRVGSHIVGKKYRSDHELGKKNNIPLFRLTSTDEHDPYAPNIKICIIPEDNELYSRKVT
jgi:hypothetical protein